MTKQFKIEFEEEHVPKGQPLEVSAESVDHIKLFDVIPVGQETRFRYAVIWENGDDGVSR
jgi:hypothetical protein